MVKIFPNPTTGIIQIIKNTVNEAEIYITDISGKVVLCASSYEGNSHTIDFSDKPNGVYFVYIKTNSETLIQKIIVSK
jgi:hypothetical protein